MKKIACVLLGMIMTVVSLSGCGNNPGGSGGAAPRDPYVNGSPAGNDGSAYAADEGEAAPADEMAAPDWNTEEYSAVKETGFKSVANDPLSTFSADVDTASYSNIRRMIEDGYTMDEIPAGAVRIEEMLNYFSYDYRLPEKGEPFGVTTVIGDCPWNADAKLLQIGLKTQAIDLGEAPDSNLVFLLDVSGSMYTDDKLPLLQKSFSMLAGELGGRDTVSIVTYAGADQVLLEGESGHNKKAIIEALGALEAGGSTNGADGIETAYLIAEKNFIEGGNNRVILATDGDLNVGVSSESALDELITRKRESGVYLSVLGFGTGNIKDNKMEILADHGNGNYAYIDSIGEAKKVLVEQMGATLVTVAKDVKLQVEFNPAYVKGYRLLGYENRALATQDFDDDGKDAGEIGAGHMVTALYEIVPVDSGQEIPETALKYQDNKNDTGVRNGEWLSVKIRYKEPDADESILKEYPVTDEDLVSDPPEDFYFAAAVAEFGLMLRDSEYKGEASFENIRELLKNVDTDADDYKDEFVYLVKKLQRASR
ncbi:MAG: von Willebrand factor type A domain-containing protein [Lachnospiraceae bacterium]|nr:von Willebrand factor type A domain-containing protein [Lachnospiraceae bacterium]